MTNSGTELTYKASTVIDGKKKERFRSGVACRTEGNARFFSSEPNYLKMNKLFDKLGLISAAHFGERVRCYGVSSTGVAALSKIEPLKEALEFLTGPCGLTVEVVANGVMIESTVKRVEKLDTSKIEQALEIIAKLLDESQTQTLSREIPFRKLFVRIGLGWGIGIGVLWMLALFTASDGYFAFAPLILPSLAGVLLWALICFAGGTLFFKKHPMGRHIVCVMTVGGLACGIYAGAAFAVLANSWLPSESQTVSIAGTLHVYHGRKTTIYSVHVDKAVIPEIYGEQLNYAPMPAKKYREIANKLGGDGSQSGGLHGRFEVRVNRGFFHVPYIAEVRLVS